MNVIKTPIDGVAIIEPRLFKDARGFAHGFSVLSEKIRCIRNCRMPNVCLIVIYLYVYENVNSYPTIAY